MTLLIDLPETPMRRTFLKVCDVFGYSPEGARLLRSGTSDVWEVPAAASSTPYGTVVKIGDLASIQLSEWEIRAATWLRVCNLDVVRPRRWVGSVPQVDMRPAVPWHHIGPHRPGSAIDMGNALAELHVVGVPLKPGILREFNPMHGQWWWLSKVSVDEETKRRLTERLESLEYQVTEMNHSMVGNLGVVHGDPNGTNFPRTEDGRVVMLDFEMTGFGLIEWDLAAIAVDSDLFGTPESEYRMFAAAYGGYDVKRWEYYPLMREVIAMRMALWAKHVADRSGSAAMAANADHRISCVLGDVEAGWKWAALID